MIKKNYSATTYLKRKKVMPTSPTQRPKFAINRALRPHRKPIEAAPYTNEVDAPGTKVKTKD